MSTEPACRSIDEMARRRLRGTHGLAPDQVGPALDLLRSGVPGAEIAARLAVRPDALAALYDEYFGHLADLRVPLPAPAKAAEPPRPTTRRGPGRPRKPRGACPPEPLPDLAVRILGLIAEGVTSGREIAVRLGISRARVYQLTKELSILPPGLAARGRLEARVARLADAGRSLAEIRDELGVSPGSLRRICRRLGIRPGRTTRPAPSLSRLGEVRALRREGLSGAAIGRRLGMSPMTVCRLLRIPES